MTARQAFVGALEVMHGFAEALLKEVKRLRAPTLARSQSALAEFLSPLSARASLCGSKIRRAPLSPAAFGWRALAPAAYLSRWNSNRARESRR